MDATALGIAVGLVAAAAYTAVRALRQSSFDIGTVLLTFLGGFSIPGGTELIHAAIVGNAQALPESWREYVAVAGIAAIGLSVHYLVQSLRNVWQRPVTATPATNPSSDETSTQFPDRQGS